MSVGAPDLPVFLVGCHRSGTTLLRYFLDAHEHLACPPESKFIAGLEELFHYPQAQPAWRSLGFTRADVLHEMRQFVDSIMSRFAARQGKTRWVDKTPNYYRNLPFIDKLFGGNVLYLFLLRHPLDCIASLESTFQNASADHDDPEIRRVVTRHGVGRAAWARYWEEVTQALLSFAASHPGRCHILRYEDLVVRTEDTLGRLFEFLGETPLADPGKAFTTVHTAGFEDPKAARSKEIHTGSVGRWHSWSQAEIDTTWLMVGRTAEYAGYTARISP